MMSLSSSLHRNYHHSFSNCDYWSTRMVTWCTRVSPGQAGYFWWNVLCTINVTSASDEWDTLFTSTQSLIINNIWRHKCTHLDRMCRLLDTKCWYWNTRSHFMYFTLSCSNVLLTASSDINTQLNLSMCWKLISYYKNIFECLWPGS